MRHFEQRTNTDCLLTAAECLFGRPREDWDIFLSWYKSPTGDFFSYAALANIIRAEGYKGEFHQAWVSGAACIGGPPAIYGLCFEGQGSFHACFWNGWRLWDGATKAFVPKGTTVRVVYILQPYGSSPYAQDPLYTLDRWDAGIPPYEKWSKEPYMGSYWPFVLED